MRKDTERLMPAGSRPTGALSSERVAAGIFEAILERIPLEHEASPLQNHLDSGGGVVDVVRALLSTEEFGFRSRDLTYMIPVLAPDPVPPSTPRIYLSHVPKTGGTSLREMMRPYFAAKEFCADLTLAQLYRLSAAQLRSFRFIGGHFGPLVPQLLADVPLVTVTVIREPIATIRSTYGQYRREGRPGNRAAILARELPFAEWVRHHATRHLWSNTQSRHLALLRRPPRLAELETDPEGFLPDVDDAELERAALETLLSTSVVGTTDRLPEVARAALAAAGLRLGTIPSHRHDNVGSELPVLDDTSHSWLEDHNRIDSVLFSQAAERSEELLQR